MKRRFLQPVLPVVFVFLIRQAVDFFRRYILIPVICISIFFLGNFVKYFYRLPQRIVFALRNHRLHAVLIRIRPLHRLFVSVCLHPHLFAARVARRHRRRLTERILVFRVVRACNRHLFRASHSVVGETICKTAMRDARQFSLLIPIHHRIGRISHYCAHACHKVR